MAWVAGIDGCPFGWVAVLRDTMTGACRCHSKKTFAEILSLSENPEFIAVDIPIGLMNEAIPGGRECDSLTRKLLGYPRRCSVFSPPARVALAHTGDCAAASRANRLTSAHEISLSKQTCAIMPKIKEVDDAFSSQLQKKVFEVHPELSFYEINKHRPMMHKKKSAAGVQERRLLLDGAGFGSFLCAKTENRDYGVAMDDLLDASIACWTAHRIMEGVAISVPESSSQDSKNLRMQIWR
jgi:predicted RNase H-like nuclease